MPSFIAINTRGITRITQGGDGSWERQRLLQGQDVRCLAAHPANGQTIYAGTQGQGLLRSNDAGQTWTASGLDGFVVKALAISPHDSCAIYAGVKPAGVWRSQDGGQNWHELEAFKRIRGRKLWFSPAEPPGTAYVQAILVSPKDPEVLIAGIEFGAVVRSEDGGLSWSGHRRGALRDCHSLAIHPFEGDRVYQAGAVGAGAAQSTDGGKIWKQDNRGLDRHYGWACAVDPADPEIWYASLSPSPMKAHLPGRAEAAIFRKRGANPWKKLSGGLPEPIPDMP